MKHQRILIVPLIFYITWVNAQVVQTSDLALSQSGELSFNLLIAKNTSERERYDIRFYGSHDNYEKPLGYQVSNVEPGRNYPIRFDGPSEIGEFSGPLQIKVKAIASVFPVQPTIKENSKFKKGKNVSISWSDYHESGWYDLELHQNNQLVHSLVKSHRGVNFNADIPKDLAKGKNYQLRIVPRDNPEAASDYLPVAVVPAMGLGIKLIPFLAGAAGAGAYIVLNGEDPTGDTPIVDPPGTPDGN